MALADWRGWLRVAMMATDRRDPLIDALVADLTPVRARRWTREALLLAAVVVIELVLFVLQHGVRPDMPRAMNDMAFWWKSTSLAVLAGLAAATALVSLDPAVSTARRLSRLWLALAVIVAAALAFGWLIDAGNTGSRGLGDRLEWHEGMECLVAIMVLSLPALVGLAVLMRRGASTRPGRTALAVGLAAACIGAFVFGFRCEHEDPLYLAVWYGGAALALSLLARMVLPRLARW